MTYEYMCQACGHQWEAEQSISEKPLTRCPDCRKHKAKRQVSGGAGFILKGGGWYADGYGSKQPASETSASGDSKKQDKKAKSNDKAADKSSDSVKAPSGSESGSSKAESGSAKNEAVA